MSLKYSLTASKKCRLCLRKTETYINLFSGSFQQMILELTSLEISEEDSHPKIACISCIDEIQQATKTRKRILECHKKLEEFNKNESKNHIINQPEIVILTDYSEESQDTVEDLNQDASFEDMLRYEDYSDVTELADFEIKTELADDSNDITYRVLDHLDTNNENETDKSENESPRSVTVTEYSQSILDKIKEVFPPERRKCKRTVIKLDQHFICDECGEDFSCNRYAFNLHKLKHKKSPCKICGIIIRTDNMSKHLDCHTSGPRICDLCGVTCKNIESLRGHIFYMHRKSADEYKCDQCSRTFRMKYKLEQHKNKEHIGARRHICHICQKKFFTLKDMNSHINMTHKKLRPHICKHCQKGFSSKYALKTHIRQHTNETPYKCSICAEGFRQNVSLRTHLKSKHNIQETKNFPCEFCGKPFGSYFALKVHLRLHNDNNYQCEECKEYFHQRIYLVNHLKIVHNLDEGAINIKKFQIMLDDKSDGRCSEEKSGINHKIEMFGTMG